MVIVNMFWDLWYWKLTYPDYLLILFVMFYVDNKLKSYFIHIFWCNLIRGDFSGGFSSTVQNLLVYVWMTIIRTSANKHRSNVIISEFELHLKLIIPVAPFNLVLKISDPTCCSQQNSGFCTLEQNCRWVLYNKVSIDLRENILCYAVI